MGSIGQALRPQGHFAGYENGALRPHRDGNDFDGIAIEQTASRIDQRGFVGGGSSCQFPKLAKVRLDEINACFQSGLQEGPGRIHDSLAMRFRNLSEPTQKS